MENPFATLGRHDDHAQSHETSHENLVLPKWYKTWILKKGSHPETTWRTGNFKLPRQLHWAPTDFFPLFEGRTNFAGPRTTGRRGSNGTYSTRPSSTTSEVLTLGLDAVSLRVVPP